MKRKNQKNNKRLLVLLTFTLTLSLILPLGFIQAEAYDDAPFDSNLAPLYDATAENNIADPEGTRAIMWDLTPVFSVQERKDSPGTYSLVGTFVNTSPYPIQGVSYSGILLANQEELYGSFSEYILMPGDTQRIVFRWNIFPEETDYMIEYSDEIQLQTMSVSFFDSPGYVSTVTYDAINDVVEDVYRYDVDPLQTEPLMDISDLKVNFIDPGTGVDWIEFYVENQGDKPILSFDMYYQDSDFYLVRLQDYSTILPGESSADIFVTHDGPIPDSKQMTPMSIQVTFFEEGVESTVRYDYGPSMYRDFTPASPDEDYLGSDYSSDSPAITEASYFPEDVLAVEQEVVDPEALLPILASLKPEFTIQELTEGEAHKMISASFTNTTPYLIDFIDFSGKIPSSNKPLQFSFSNYKLKPNEIHTKVSWLIYEDLITDMVSVDDFELSQVTVSFADGIGHISQFTYDTKLKRIPSVQGYDYLNWVTEPAIDINRFGYEFYDQGDGDFSFVLKNLSELELTFLEYTFRTGENHLLRIQSFTPVQPDTTTEPNWIYTEDLQFDPYQLEPLALTLTYVDGDREISVFYDYGLDMYQVSEY